VCEGLGTRVYARINEDGTLESATIPQEIRDALNSLDDFEKLKPVGFEQAFNL